MQQTTTNSLRNTGTIFRITDEELLEKFPHLRGQGLTVSVMKRSGPRIYIQYYGPQGAGTLKLTRAVEIEIIGESENLSLASLINKYKFRDAKPSRVKVNCNGEVDEFRISHDFWDQNPSNIRLKGLTKFGSKYKVPGAYLVLEERF